MSECKLRVAILTGPNSPATCATISAITELHGVEICGILTESHDVPFKIRLRNLRRNVIREGWSYLYFWCLRAFQEALERMAAELVSSTEVRQLLAQAFPQRVFSLHEFANLKEIPLEEFRSLNAPEAAAALRRLNADVGIVLGTRVLKHTTFSVPRMGCVNLHKGKVPEYRGLPPGFWELYNNERAAGVTVHFVNEGLDTGDVLGEDLVEISSKDTPITLRRKLDAQGSALLSRCITELAEGRAVRRPQPPSSCKPRTSPTRRQRRELNHRLGIVASMGASWTQVLKTLLYLFVCHSGLLQLTRAWRKLTHKTRTCVLLYHRVNDQADDSLTVSVQQFAEHLVILRRYCSIVSTSRLLAMVESRSEMPPNSIAIHFDDCYRDVYTQGARLLAAARMPACIFISSGFVGTNRAFQHDSEKCPFPMENLSADEVRELVHCDFEVGAHTVNHVDLGQCSAPIAEAELRQGKSDLERIIGTLVKLFSYPFGREQNIRPEIIPLVEKAGYRAMFSAHGGYVSANSEMYALRRIGMSGQFRPLDLLMEVEGFSLGSLRQRWRSSKKKMGPEQVVYAVHLRDRE